MNFFFLASFEVSLIAYTLWILNTANGEEKRTTREKNIRLSKYVQNRRTFLNRITFFCKYRHTRDRKLTSAVSAQ